MNFKHSQITFLVKTIFKIKNKKICLSLSKLKFKKKNTHIIVVAKNGPEHRLWDSVIYFLLVDAIFISSRMHRENKDRYTIKGKAWFIGPTVYFALRERNAEF